MKALVAWGGGKEISLACYRAKDIDDLEIAYLLNMTSEDGARSRTHGIGSELLRAQAEAMGVPIVQRKTTWGDYEEIFKGAVSNLKKEDVRAGVFGDIDLREHRDWVERVCSEMSIRPFLPLWEEEREKLLEEFIDLGFEAIVVATRAEFLGEEWLGRRIDGDFVREMKAIADVDLCGEKGEYHTYVYGGPIFSAPVEFVTGEKRLQDDHWFLELRPKNGTL